MKRALMVLSVLVIVASAVVVIVVASRKPSDAPVPPGPPQLSDDAAIVAFAADTALPSLVAQVAKRCGVPQTGRLELVVVFDTIEHGIKVTSVRQLADAGTPALDCVATRLVDEQFIEPRVALALDRQYEVDVSVPVSANTGGY